jgi:hypothetical protein
MQAPEDAAFAVNYVYENAKTRAEQELAIQALRDKCDILWAQLDALYFRLRSARLAASRGVSHREGGSLMAAPLDSSQPRLAAGCRWGGSEADRVILFPEGAIKLQGTGRQVLERCDGKRTFRRDHSRVAKTVRRRGSRTRFAPTSAMFLEQLQRKRRIVDY